VYSTIVVQSVMFMFTVASVDGLKPFLATSLLLANKFSSSSLGDRSPDTRSTSARRPQIHSWLGSVSYIPALHHTRA